MGASAGAELPVFSPLLSQPHMELALGTPLHILRADGRDRAMARGAFAADIPANIAGRRYKGLRATPTRKWILESFGDVREILMDGYLVQEGILDRRALGSAFSDRASLVSLSEGLVACICVEVWVRGSRMHNAKAA
jgi:asparagine synthase (glutamine-hydrolysing)